MEGVHVALEQGLAGFSQALTEIVVLRQLRVWVVLHGHARSHAHDNVRPLHRLPVLSWRRCRPEGEEAGEAWLRLAVFLDFLDLLLQLPQRFLHRLRQLIIARGLKRLDVVVVHAEALEEALEVAGRLAALLGP